MNARLIAAGVICACLALSAATATGKTARTASPNASQATLTVWLQEDARDNWGSVVNSATQSFDRLIRV